MAISTERLRAGFTLSVVLLVFCACGDTVGQNDSQDHPPPDPWGFAEETPEIAGPDELDFGRVEVGETVEAEVELENRGDGSLRVHGWDARGDAEVAEPSFGVGQPLEIVAGEEALLRLAYSPTRGADGEGRLRIHSDDP